MTSGGHIKVKGQLNISNKLYGFLKPPKRDYIFQPFDPLTKKQYFKSVPIQCNFWDEFEYFELIQNMRQFDDPEFAQMLDRIRVGCQTD